MSVFGETELESLLGAGAITDRSVRIWARAARPGDFELVLTAAEGEVGRVPVHVAGGDTDCTGAWTYPDDFSGAAPLAPDTRHRVRLERWGESIAEGRFRTAPESAATAPRRWTFGAFSCHQPFSSDGSINRAGSGMLVAAHRALSEADARFVLMMGDQIYGDYPPELSLFDEDYFATIAPPGRRSILGCTRAEVRAIYQQRHRQFWALPGFGRIESSFASYPILDDHEIVDNFGTDPAHAEPPWEAVREGGLDAFFDYQISRVLRRGPRGARPRELCYGFRWGPAAFYVMDVRSQRRTRDGKTTVYSRAQLEALRTFLEANADCGLFGLVTTIPLVHVDGALVRAASALLSQGSDLHERWGHPLCVEHRDRLVRVLYDHSLRHPHQQILLLGGDVHTGAAYEVAFEGGPRWYQLISSAISNSESGILNKAAEVASQAFSEIDVAHGPRADVHLLQATESRHKNPIGALNIGLVDVIETGEGVALELRLVSDSGDGSPEVVFSSGVLPPPGRRHP